MVVVEKYPDLKANQNFLDLQAQLEGTENRITVARNRYNQAAQAYNVTVRQFPVNLTAMVFGYKVKPNFAVENERHDRQAADRGVQSSSRPGARDGPGPGHELSPGPRPRRRRAGEAPLTMPRALTGSLLLVATALLAAGALLVATAAPAQAFAPIPALTTRVTDTTRTLTPDQVASLDAKLAAFEQTKGSQVAVLIVPTQPEEIDQYSIRVVDQWKLGRKKVDDAVSC